MDTDIAQLESRLKDVEKRLENKKEEIVRGYQQSLIYMIKIKYKKSNGLSLSYIYAYCSTYDKVEEIMANYTGPARTYKVEVKPGHRFGYEVLSKLDRPQYGNNGYISD